MFQINIQNLKNNIDFKKIIESSGVKLKKIGREYKGCCPFHADKSPSLSVNIEKKLFFCFACNQGGDAISYVMKIKNTDFRTALDFLVKHSNHLPPVSTPTNMTVDLSQYQKQDPSLLKNIINIYHPRQSKVLGSSKDRLRQSQSDIIFQQIHIEYSHLFNYIK